MNKMSIFLSVIMLVSLAVWLAPGVLAMNHGRILRNIAIWLAIFTGLALAYKNFGPESEHPLFGGPAIMSGEPAENAPDEKKNNDQNFTPPQE